MRPTGALVSWTSVTNRNLPLAIMCNRTPQELTSYVFNWKYGDATLKSHYSQAAAQTLEFVAESRCTDSEIKVISKYQLSPPIQHFKMNEAAWMSCTIRISTASQEPHKEFHMLLDDFKDSLILRPGSAGARRVGN